MISSKWYPDVRISLLSLSVLSVFSVLSPHIYACVIPVRGWFRPGRLPASLFSPLFLGFAFARFVSLSLSWINTSGQSAFVPNPGLFLSRAGPDTPCNDSFRWHYWLLQIKSLIWNRWSLIISPNRIWTRPFAMCWTTTLNDIRIRVRSIETISFASCRVKEWSIRWWTIFASINSLKHHRDKDNC